MCVEHFLCFPCSRLWDHHLEWRVQEEQTRDVFFTKESPALGTTPGAQGAPHNHLSTGCDIHKGSEGLYSVLFYG